MKEGKSLTELAKEIERQKNGVRDFVAPGSAFKMTAEAELDIEAKTAGPLDKAFAINDYAHGQIANKLGIPTKYYDKMLLDDPRLLATNVNHWLDKDGKNKLIRTLDGRVRAFLSEKYRPLDNYDLMSAVLPVLQQNKADFVSGEVTDSRFYIKALQPKLQAEVRVGDIVQAGISIQNSEVGASSIKVEPLVYRLVCKNGMITNIALRKFHIGKMLGGDGEFNDEVYEVLSDKTKKLTDTAFWNQVKDIASAAFSEKFFGAAVEAMQLAAGRKIEKSPEKVIEAVIKKYGHSDEVGEEMMRALLAEKDFTQYGLANAATATSQVVDSYDLATELERTGGKIIELGREEFADIAS